MKKSAYQENCEEFVLYYLESKEIVDNKIYKSLRLAKSAKTQLEKRSTLKYGIKKRKIIYTDWEDVD